MAIAIKALASLWTRLVVPAAYALSRGYVAAAHGVQR